MKKLAKSLLVILVGLFMSVNVMADVQTGKTEPDYSTDYYMIVESKAGGMDFYSQPDFDSTKLNDEQITLLFTRLKKLAAYTEDKPNEVSI